MSLWTMMVYSLEGTAAFCAIWALSYGLIQMVRWWWYRRPAPWELAFETTSGCWVPAPYRDAVPGFTGRYVTTDTGCRNCGDQPHHHRWWGACRQFQPRAGDICGS